MEEAAGRGDPRESGYEIRFRDGLVYRLPDFDAIPARPVRTRLLFFFSFPSCSFGPARVIIMYRTRMYLTLPLRYTLGRFSDIYGT